MFLSKIIKALSIVDEQCTSLFNSCLQIVKKQSVITTRITGYEKIKKKQIF